MSPAPVKSKQAKYEQINRLANILCLWLTNIYNKQPRVAGKCQ